MKSKTTGAKIRKMRKEKGLTLGQLASRLGISASAVSQYERDVIKPTIPMILMIASEFNCLVEDIVSDDDYLKMHDNLAALSDAVNTAATTPLQIEEQAAAFEAMRELLEGGHAIPDVCLLYKATATHTRKPSENDCTIEIHKHDKCMTTIFASYEDIKTIGGMFSILTIEGRTKVAEYMRDIGENPRYRLVDCYLKTKAET